MFSQIYWDLFHVVSSLFILIGLLYIPSVYFLKSKGTFKHAMGAENGHAKTNFGFGDVKVSKILVHPIKSCKGTSVPSARYTPSGLENDRKWGIINVETKKVITAREHSRMVLITPNIVVDEHSPYGGYLEVSFPIESHCESFTIPLNPTSDYLEKCQRLDDLTMWERAIDGYICQALSSNSRTPSAIISSFLGVQVHLVVKGPRPRACKPTDKFPSLEATHVFQDGYPLLFMSQESVGAVETELRKNVDTIAGVDEKWREDKLPIERFRPNIIFEGGGPFCEDNFEEICITPKSETPSESSPRFVLVSHCVRCLLPNVNPETGIPDKAVPFKVLTKFRIGVDKNNKYRPCLGVNGCPMQDGRVDVGDTVHVKRICPSDA